MNYNDKKYLHFLFSLSLILFWSVNLFSQHSASYLEKKKERLEKAIEYADLLMDDARHKKHVTLSDLALLQTKIDSRKALIDNYIEAQNMLFDTIFLNLLQINTISTQLQELKDEYALMINSAYQNHNFYKRLLYVLASEDINQAYSRFNYYKYYAKIRNAQIENIRQVEEAYFNKVDQLEARAEQNQQIIDEMNAMYAKLKDEVAQKNAFIQSLNAKVDQLAAEQGAYRKSANALEEKIEDVIKEDAMRPVEAKPDPQMLNTPTPEDIIVASAFGDNYGKLPWPLERGIVSAKFGEQNYPDLQGVKIKNNGINLLTQKGAMARSVFGGEVTRVISAADYNNVVILRHGNYLSVYSNLSDVFVEAGMQVGIKQALGVVFTNEEESKTELHFEIWKGKEMQDPLKWISNLQNSETTLRNNP